MKKITKTLIAGSMLMSLLMVAGCADNKHMSNGSMEKSNSKNEMKEKMMKESAMDDDKGMAGSMEPMNKTMESPMSKDMKKME